MMFLSSIKFYANQSRISDIRQDMSRNLSLQALRAANQAQEQATKRTEIRRKSLLILVHQYLLDEGFQEAASILVNESQLNTAQFATCDNVNLPGVLEQYEAWFLTKYEKYPRLAKKLSVLRSQPTKSHNCSSDFSNNKSPRRTPFSNRKQYGRQSSNLSRATSDPSLHDNGDSVPNGSRSGRLSSRSDSRKREDIARRPLTNRRPREVAKFSSGEEKKDSSKSSSDTDSEKTPNPSYFNRQRPPQQILDLKAMIRDYTRLEDNIGDIGKGPRDKNIKGEVSDDNKEGKNDELLDDKLLKPPGVSSLFTGELKDLANTIQREILVENPGVQWTDILGVEDAKRLLKEAVVYPLKYPQLFVGRFKPWRGILLYGPPGTGKTLLAKAVATECRTTFFNISATTLVSKWRGDSEKLVRVLFEMARYYAPSTIFVDEVDALMASRQGEQEHEASRRMKTQLLVELDGLTKNNDHVFLLAASNIPWELDPAMLRRLEKRILVPLPNIDARINMFRHYLPEILPDLAESGQFVETHLNYNELGEQSEGYSGSDLQIVCREAAMSCLRKIFNVLEDNTVDDKDLPDLTLDAIQMEDVVTALKRTKPAQNDNKKYLEWHSKFGSV